GVRVGGRALRKCLRATGRFGCDGALTLGHRSDDRVRFLAGGRAVQVLQRLFVDHLVERGKIRSYPLHVEAGGRRPEIWGRAAHCCSSKTKFAGSLAATSRCTCARIEADSTRRTMSLAQE